MRRRPTSSLRSSTLCPYTAFFRSEGDKRGRLLASELMEAAAADIEFAAGRFQVSGTDRSFTLFGVAAFAAGRGEALAAEADFVTTAEAHPSELGRASCRERVCQYV